MAGIHIPKGQSTGYLIGIDPGTKFLGLSIFEVDVINMLIVGCQAITLNADKLGRKEDHICEIHGDRFRRTSELGSSLLKVFNDTLPFCVVYEHPFYNPSRPGAFEALCEITTIMRQSLIHYSPGIPLERIDPSSIKNGVGVKGNTGGESGKALMKIAVSKLSDLNYNGDTPLTNLSEHAIDALAVGYTKISELRRLLC